MVFTLSPLGNSREMKVKSAFMLKANCWVTSLKTLAQRHSQRQTSLVVWLNDKKLSPVAEEFLEMIRKEKENIIHSKFQWYVDAINSLNG